MPRKLPGGTIARVGHSALLSPRFDAPWGEVRVGVKVWVWEEDTGTMHVLGHGVPAGLRAKSDGTAASDRGHGQLGPIVSTRADTSENDTCPTRVKNAKSTERVRNDGSAPKLFILLLIYET